MGLGIVPHASFGPFVMRGPSFEPILAAGKQAPIEP